MYRTRGEEFAHLHMSHSHVIYIHPYDRDKKKSFLFIAFVHHCSALDTVGAYVGGGHLHQLHQWYLDTSVSHLHSLEVWWFNIRGRVCV